MPLNPLFISSGRNEKPRIPCLDGWRAVAVSLVIASHSYTMLVNGHTRIGDVLASAVHHAGYGVDIFFGISGFLICTLLIEEKNQRRAISLQGFYIRRAFRILPPMLTYLAMLLILKTASAVPDITNRDLLSSALFVRNYFGDGVSWYTIHFWSLAIEEHFYLLAPFIFARFGWRTTLGIAIAAVIVCAVIRVVEWQVMATMVQVEFRTESRLDAIIYGAILALLLNNEQCRTWIRANVGYVHVAAIVVAAAAILIIAPPFMPLRRTVVALVVPVALGYTVLNPHGRAGAVLELAWMRYIGRLSYSLYVWQQIFLVPGERPLGMLQSFPYAWAGIALCVLFSYYVIEKPFIRMGHRLAGLRKIAPAPLHRRTTPSPVPEHAGETETGTSPGRASAYLSASAPPRSRTPSSSLSA